ncbi:MAG: hypothetical protein COB54_05145 [Alphaproteobacteria bacterium]|nr:MAG: hypothetical protein COB54_05145 [Alphaproteobacteria bacterium]
MYNYWFGLTHDCDIPPLKSLTPEDIAPYKGNMVLIDLRDPDNEPTLQVIGQLLAEDLDQDLSFKAISDIPRRTLLSRITDHYMEVLGNKSPISFDAEFNNKERQKILYRGILLPFSDDGDKINFILGAIRWISEEDLATAKKSPQETPVMAEDVTTPLEISEITESAINDITAEELPVPEADTADPDRLMESLEDCRQLVQGQSPSDNRSRKSLYETLGAVLDFHVLCLASPDSYGDLLQTEGLKAQKRAPFTPTLKLCFGRDYDKTRLTEYAAALSFARKNHQNGTSLPDFLDSYPGGIKGCVKAERASQNSQDTPAVKKVKITLEDCREAIENMTALAGFEIDENHDNDDQICLLLARRNGSRIEVIKILKQDESVLGPILQDISNDP